MRQLLALVLLAFPLAAEDSASAVDRLLDRIVERESALIDLLQMHTPVVETYIQEFPETAGDDGIPSTNIPSRTTISWDRSRLVRPWSTRR